MSEFSKSTYSGVGTSSVAVGRVYPSIGDTPKSVAEDVNNWEIQDIFSKTIPHGMSPAAYFDAMRRFKVYVSEAQAPSLSMTAGQHVSPAVLVDMIHSRMRIHKPEKAPDFISAHYHQNHNKVSVFIAHEGQSVVLTDEATLFPSDTMITQIRMLTG